MSWKIVGVWIACLLGLIAGLGSAMPGGLGGYPLSDRVPREVGPLDKFLGRKDREFRWTVVEQPATADQAVPLQYTSQSWHGREWTHRARVYRPKQIKFADAAIVLVMGFPTAYDGLFGQLGAEASGARCVVINDVPNQPLEGKIEDDLLADSLERMLEKKDPAESLIFPMTKAVLRGMDAVQEWSKTGVEGEIKRFILVAPSKRAWAVWLAAAEDKRVKGFIPIGYNNLRVDRQIPNQKAQWGEFSSFLKQYTQRGLAEKMLSKKGKRLMDCLDPYTFRHRLNKPKLIIDSTNNGYWTLDALNLYWDPKLEPADLLYIPNAGHYMEQQIPGVFGSIIAWSRRVLGGEKGKLKPLQETVWYATAPTQDFREVKWESREYGGKFDAREVAKEGYVAWFVEREYEGEPQKLRLTTGVRVEGVGVK